MEPDQQNHDTCPRCRTSRLVSWDELTTEQQFLARRLPLSADFTPAQRKKHRFCTRCWFEDDMRHADRA